jgi:hypothetical protein
VLDNLLADDGKQRTIILGDLATWRPGDLATWRPGGRSR